MATAFIYHIGEHLYRPSLITTNTTYSGVDYNAQSVYNSATSIAVDSLSASQINYNFFCLARGLIDTTWRVAEIENGKVDSGSPIVGMVNYSGCQEKEGTFYGGTTYSAVGTTQLTFPFTMDASTQLAFRVAVGDGIIYDSGGSVSENNTLWHSFTFGESGAGSPFATPSAMITYMRTKLIGNTCGSAQTTFSILGTTNPGSQTWGSGTWWNGSFGSLTATPRTVNIRINDGAVIAMTFNTNYSTWSACIAGIQNAINTAIGNANTFVLSASSNNMLVTPSSDRTVAGIWQYTLSESSSGILSWLGLCNGTNTSVSAWNLNSVIDFTATLVSSSIYTMNIVGVQSYAKITFMDRDSAASITGLIASWAIPIVNRTVYYQTRAPLSTYSRILNYGGRFIATSAQFTNCTITGTLTYSGTAWTGTQSFTNISVSGTSTLSGNTTIGASGSNTLTIPAATTFNNGVTISGSAAIGTNSSNTLSIAATTTFSSNVSLTDANAILTIGTIQLSSNGAVISASSGSFTTATVTNLNVANLNFTGNLKVSTLATTSVAGAFDTGPTNPTANNRTNYNGYLYSTKYYMNSSTTSGTGTALVMASDGGIIPSSSDIRLKKNIDSIPYGLAEIMKLNPVSFFWKPEYNTSTNRNIGFIAQELKEVIPESVFGEATETSYYGVNFDYIIPVLTKAIQELNDKIKILELRV